MKTKDEVQTEALAAVLPLKRAGVGVSMGVGKTLLGLKHANGHYTEHARFLVVAPKKSVFKSWREEAEEWNLLHLLPHIKFTTYRSLSKEDLDYDIIYLDECHSLLDSHDIWLSKFQGKILGLSGTPPKFEKSEKGRMVAKYCPIVYKYITKDAVKDKILNDYRIIVHMLDLDKAKNMKVEKGDKVWYASEESTYLYWSNRCDNAKNGKEAQICRVMRMKAMMGFQSKEILGKRLFDSSTGKVILFANTQEQAQRLCSDTYHSKEELSEENLEKFKKGVITKLSCVLQISEGINIPGLREGIILHSYGNERKTAQRIGRLLRLNPKDTATCHILCYRNTVDEFWVKSALQDFDQAKITWNY